MDFEKLLKSLTIHDFSEIVNKSKKFEQDSTIYAKEIREDIFLLFVILKDKRPRNIHAFIARFNDKGSIGIEEPKEIMFYLLISKAEDIHYFERYIIDSY